MRLIPAAALALSAALALAAPAGAADPMTDLTNLYRITISNDLCDFPLSAAQSDELTRRTEDLETQLNLSDDASTRMYEQIEAQMTKQVEAGLCKASGEWAREYARQVESLAAK